MVVPHNDGVAESGRACAISTLRKIGLGALVWQATQCKRRFRPIGVAVFSGLLRAREDFQAYLNISIADDGSFGRDEVI